MKSLFLCYAKEDRPAVADIYVQLRSSGLRPFMDEPPRPHESEGIPPGAEWDSWIRTKVREVNHVLAFISKESLRKEGYVQREYRLALDSLMERPPQSPYLIPVLLEECDPSGIRVDTLDFGKLQWYRLYRDGPERLVTYLTTASAGRGEEPGDLRIIDLENELRLLRGRMAYEMVPIPDHEESIELAKSEALKELNNALEREVIRLGSFSRR